MKMKQKKKIKLGEREVQYVLQKRSGTRSVRLAIYNDGYFVVNAPKWYPLYVINKFIMEQADWVLEKLAGSDTNSVQRVLAQKEADYRKKKEWARIVIRERVEFFNRQYNFEFKRIAIKNQRTCWGSCSQKGNLNFNYRVAELPENLRDYIIVHELCHLKELNHSRKFWELVAKVMPDYKRHRQDLKNNYYQY